MRVAACGKSFVLAGSPFQFRGVRVKLPPQPADPLGDGGDLGDELGAAASAGFTVASLAPPPESEIERACASGLRFMLELDDASLSRLATTSRRERRSVVDDLALRARRAVQAWQGSQALLGCALGNIAGGMASELAIALHDADASLIVAWRAAWPCVVPCPSEFDFLLVDCGLATPQQLEPALMACHAEVGDRPLVLGSVSVAGAETASLQDISWVIDTAIRCGVGGTIVGKRPPSQDRASETEMARINRRTVIDLDVEWPSISIVVCAHNAAGTIDECLSHCLELDYPDLEVIVVDDGSTDTTPDIVATHLDVRLITISRSGLSVARNVGYQSARGELIAYLDADAYPAPQWPWYLALAAIGPGVGGSGGPNIPPSQEPASARVVARSPGGPVPQLVSADRAEHIPGCNMAFWRHVLEGLDGFDPVLEAAEDLEFEWRVRDGGCDIAYHPAALVWHHRRPGLGAYLRQQRHYGRGQAILERRHPERFVPGHRVRRAAARLRPRRTRTGGPTSYPVKYLTLPRHQGAATELAHQWGVPQTLVVCATAPLGLIRPKLAAPALVATICVGALLVIDIVAAGKDCARFERRLGIRASIAVFSLLRPLAFRWGHLREWSRLHVAGSDWPARPAASNPADCRALDR